MRHGRLEEKILAAMNSGRAENLGMFEKALYLLSRLYRAGALYKSRAFEYGAFAARRLPCRVVSVGNLTVGGSGKTPMTLYLARMLAAEGLAPAVISRGYGGRRERFGGVVSNGEELLLNFREAGDEPYMMARQLKGIPLLVGADRYETGKKALSRFAPGVLVLDDAFQHRRLHRDIDLLLVDAAVGFGNGHLLPRGILREPIQAADRADAVILTRSDRVDPDRVLELRKRFSGRPVFQSIHRPCIDLVSGKGRETFPPQFGEASTTLCGRRVAGFSGIARNSEFKEMIIESGAELVDFMDFPDHYRYRRADLEAVSRRATASSADWVVTTQKDHVRIAGWYAFPQTLAVMGIRVDFGDEDGDFRRFIDEQLKCRQDGAKRPPDLRAGRR
jgi:tetraacyldisaccharide 4'-kinase